MQDWCNTGEIIIIGLDALEAVSSEEKVTRKKKHSKQITKHKIYTNNWVLKSQAVGQDDHRGELGNSACSQEAYKVASEGCHYGRRGPGKDSIVTGSRSQAADIFPSCRWLASSMTIWRHHLSIVTDKIC